MKIQIRELTCTGIIFKQFCKKCKCINYQLHMTICKKLLENTQKMLDKNQ